VTVAASSAKPANHSTYLFRSRAAWIYYQESPGVRQEFLFAAMLSLCRMRSIPRWFCRWKSSLYSREVIIFPLKLRSGQTGTGKNTVDKVSQPNASRQQI